MGSPASASSTVLEVAAMLQNNGQSTGMTLAAVDRLNNGLGISTTLIPSWQSLILTDSGDDTGAAQAVPVSPTGVNIARVAAVMRVVDTAEDGPVALDEVRGALTEAASLPLSHPILFILACAGGAGALAVIFGADNPTVVLLAALTGAVGGILRRVAGHWGAGPLPQAFLAATVSGLIGAHAMNAQLGAGAALVALCAVLILVPGPHILNGALDLLSARAGLGMCRIGWAAVILIAIGVGLLLGVQLGGAHFPELGTALKTPLPGDVIAAGVAAASYAVYFSMPYRFILWPVAAGMLAHAGHWAALSLWHCGPATAALIACLIVGTTLAPLSHALRIPFAGIGFASVVSLVPGSYVLATVNGVVGLAGDPAPELLATTASSAATAVAIIAAMAAGLAVPIHVRDVLLNRQRR
ncbi:MAG: threonine/serine exporter family protein [Mycolicibacterium neoaurum]|uniref:threonine/serine exporter family protein n=1 Tax=Mycolicibacterium neoaurum TaxID=1795 RepID=UPI002FF72849